MKYRYVAISLVIISLFPLFACHHTLTAAAGTTVKLTVPNLPRGD